ncbi:hypothetical protein [Chitinibacter sp. S2-10]|uniref:hypothetical protein n=1 Tax=Chitinibacter sp. S2-10 TaxID=3373597 RepID=UPI0039776AC8
MKSIQRKFISRTQNKKPSFIKENFSVIVTGIASIAAIGVSAAQIYIASIDKDKELQLSKINAEETRVLEEKKAKQVWMLDVAKFMTEHKKDIFGKGEKSKQLQQIMLVTFPEEITYNIFEGLSKISEDQQLWADAKKAARILKDPSTKIFYETDFPKEILSSIADTLAEGDIQYPYQDHPIPKGLTNGDIRYFSEKDKLLAQQIKNNFENHACNEGYELKLNLIPLTEADIKKPIGYVEIWLSTKAISVHSKRCSA